MNRTTDTGLSSFLLALALLALVAVAAVLLRLRRRFFAVVGHWDTGKST
jgi:hypothetical protein